jgi:hypothetical protein
MSEQEKDKKIRRLEVKIIELEGQLRTQQLEEYEKNRPIAYHVVRLIRMTVILGFFVWIAHILFN